tara:strand:- start:1168 stop:1503 length:336 start_codon:yes stop_codon:yes gene_type:complete
MIKIFDKIISLDQEIGNRRCILTKDEYQWILITGPPDADDEYIYKSGKRYFYTKFETFLERFLQKRFRALLTNWDEKRVLKALDMAMEESRELGRLLDEKTQGLIKRSWKD